MQTNELIEYFRVRVKKSKEHKIMCLDDLITSEKILEAADRLEELENENSRLAQHLARGSNSLADTFKIAEYYHRELEKKCEEITKLKPKTNKRERLKRCPFCGGKARIMKCPVGTFSGCYVVGCDKNNSCFGNVNHMTKIFLSKEAAEESWNGRAGE